MKGRHDMPYSEQKGLKQQSIFSNMIDSDNIIEESPECTLLHDHVDDIENDAHQYKTEPGMNSGFSCQGKTCCKESKPDIMAMDLKDQDLQPV